MQKRTAKHELENKNKHKCKKPKQRRTKRNTSCAFRSLAAQVLRHKRLFFIQKSIKKIIKNQHLFLSFLIAFGTHLGAIWEAKIDPRWAKLGSRRLLKRYFLKNVNFHETSAGVMSGAFPGPQDGTQNDPRSSQDGPKTVLFRFFFRFVFCVDF